MFNTPACSVFIAINYGITPSSILRHLLFSVCVMLQFPSPPSAMGASVPLLHCKFCFKLLVKAQQMYIYHLGDYLALLNNLHVFNVQKLKLLIRIFGITLPLVGPLRNDALLLQLFPILWYLHSFIFHLRFPRR